MNSKAALWDTEAAKKDFLEVARLAGIELQSNTIVIEKLSAPHLPPTKLPSGKMAVYVFSRGTDFLKVGKVGPKSQARYTTQHYNPGSAMSTLAASILSDGRRHGITDVDSSTIGAWIKANVDRVNFLMDEKIGVPVLNLLETFLHCRLKPLYEGFKSQRL